MGSMDVIRTLTILIVGQLVAGFPTRLPLMGPDTDTHSNNPSLSSPLIMSGGSLLRSREGSSSPGAGPYPEWSETAANQAFFDTRGSHVKQRSPPGGRMSNMKLPVPFILMFRYGNRKLPSASEADKTSTRTPMSASGELSDSPSSSIRFPKWPSIHFTHSIIPKTREQSKPLATTAAEVSKNSHIDDGRHMNLIEPEHLSLLSTGRGIARQRMADSKRIAITSKENTSWEGDMGEEQLPPFRLGCLLLPPRMEKLPRAILNNIHDKWCLNKMYLSSADGGSIEGKVPHGRQTLSIGLDLSTLKALANLGQYTVRMQQTQHRLSHIG